jgi:hypothetical protein
MRNAVTLKKVNEDQVTCRALLEQAEARIRKLEKNALKKK